MSLLNAARAKLNDDDAARAAAAAERRAAGNAKLIAQVEKALGITPVVGASRQFHNYKHSRTYVETHRVWTVDDVELVRAVVAGSGPYPTWCHIGRCKCGQEVVGRPARITASYTHDEGQEANLAAFVASLADNLREYRECGACRDERCPTCCQRRFGGQW